PHVQAQVSNQAALDKFDLLTTTSGWVLLGGHLFMTSNSGQTWQEIGPSIPAGAQVQDVSFLNGSTGRMLWMLTNPDGSSSFQLAYTQDRGSTWTQNSLSLFAPGEIASYAEKAQMDWFDSQTGWISVRQGSGSNFSNGTLFTTSDGGNSWKRFPLPAADKVHFSDPQLGWAIGENAGGRIFETADGGATWKDVRPADLPGDAAAILYPPFASSGRGLLVANDQGVENALRIYSLDRGSGAWSLQDKIGLDGAPGILALSLINAQDFLAVVPGTRSIVRMENGQLDVLQNLDGLSASITGLDMLSLDMGWAKSVDTSCTGASPSDPKKPSAPCTSTTRLLQTTDGGASWRALDLPAVEAPSSPSQASGLSAGPSSGSITLPANTRALTGQGFDTCEIPTLPQMQAWSGGSPYDAVNLYIGGSSRGCSNSALTSSFLFQLQQLGWKFIPTWVGPQAPCSGFSSRISSDVTTAYNQGVSEADLAVDRLLSLGLTGPDKTGSVVYYDIEYYGYDTACRSAVNSFMNGWVLQLRARGHLAGVYGSTLCNTGLSDFLNIASVPDLIWAARWYHSSGSGYYDPTADVWDLGSCIPNTAWSDHQRVRQYEGDHNETWGSLTLNIDSDVLDGVVAVLYNYPFVSSVTHADPNPTRAAVVNFTVNFNQPVTGVDKSDFSLATTGLSGASIAGVSGSGASYTVSVNTGTKAGTIRLDVLDNGSIVDAANNSLGGPDVGNGKFIWGEVYDVSRSWYGSARITADRNLVTVARPHVGSQIMAYDGFSSGSLNAYVPMLFKNAFDGTYDSALYIQNVDASNTASVTIRFYDSQGNETCSQSDTIQSLTSRGYWLPSISCLPVGWVGGVKVESNRNIVAVGRPHVGGEVFTYNGFASGSQTAYAPMLFKGSFGGTYNAALYVQNVDPTSSANVTIRFFDNLGNETCSLTDTIAPLASRGYWTPAISCLPAGWVGGAKVESDRNVAVVGRPYIGSQVLAYDGVASGSLNAYVPMLFKGSFDGTYNAALYVQNLDAAGSANVNIRFFDSTGREVCSQSDVIAPLASKGYWMPAVPCLPAGWVGGVKVEADRSIAAVGRPHIGNEVLTYNGFSGGSSNAYLPMLFKEAFDGTYNSAIYLQNVDPLNTANVTIHFYNPDGVEVCSQNTTIAPLASRGFWLPSFVCWP
ncbi:MAG: glycoside hydrolase domain-containing protein, partial [Bacteroidota bacterium]